MTRLALLSSLAVLALASGCRAHTDGPGTIRCMPGEVIEVGCAAGCGIGSCSGDPLLRLCDGSLGARDCANATTAASFRELDDAPSCGGLCPFGRVVCPASGSITVVPGGSSSASCNWESENLGVLPPGGRGAEIISCTPGAPMRVGCSDTCGIGSCDPGTARLRICDGTVTTSDCQAGPSGNWVLDVTTSTSSSQGSDCDNRCPELVVACPASGTLTVSPGASSFGGGGDFWCRWDAVEAPHRDDGTVPCTPGARVVVGCAAGCDVGACLGNGGIRVCDGGLTPADCRASGSTNLGNAFGRSSCDDACPETVVTCPPSGAITVVSASSFSSPAVYEAFACDWSVRAAGLGE
jgi:hypothetical protein